MTSPINHESVTTAQLADACIRLSVPILVAPPGMRPVTPGSRVFGKVKPVRHYGSVDVFLEAFETMASGDVLVIDNQGRLDEGCVGDLVTLEAAQQGVSGILIWGLHRDSEEIRAIGLPLFSYGSCPLGPIRLDSRDNSAAVRFGDLTVTGELSVLADSDGAIFVPTAKLPEVVRVANKIGDIERKQSERMRKGETLRQQLEFDQYLLARSHDPNLTFRQHLKTRGGAIEE